MPIKANFTLQRAAPSEVFGCVLLAYTEEVRDLSEVTVCL